MNIYSQSLFSQSVVISLFQRWLTKLSLYLFAIGLFLAFGIVGQMDYEDEIRVAAITCQQKYGQHAEFIEKEDGWYCQPLVAQWEQA